MDKASTIRSCGRHPGDTQSAIPSLERSNLVPERPVGGEWVATETRVSNNAHILQQLSLPSMYRPSKRTADVGSKAGAKRLPTLGLVACFGQYQLNTTLRRLTREGQPVRVTSRGLDLLIVLVERAGRVVSHRELLEEAWPGLTVEDSNLRVQIFHLRRTLGDSSPLSDCIESVPGRGYCFIAPVAWTSNVPREATAASAPTSIAGRRRTRRSSLQHDRRPTTEMRRGRCTVAVVLVAHGDGTMTEALLAALARPVRNPDAASSDPVPVRDHGADARPGEGALSPAEDRPGGREAILARLAFQAGVLTLDGGAQIVDALLRLVGRPAQPNSRRTTSAAPCGRIPCCALAREADY